MNFKTIRIFYWAAFVLSVVILPLNFGLGLIAMAIIILPVLVLHLTVGLQLAKIQHHKLLIVLSVCNLLLFSLIRPDGIHSINDNGLSALLGISEYMLDMIQRMKISTSSPPSYCLQVSWYWNSN